MSQEKLGCFELNKIYCMDCLEGLKKLPDNSIDLVVTSPPYWGLRNYGVDGQIGLEPTLEEYLEKMLKITAELKRVLKETGVVFWNHGDCYGNDAGRNNRVSKQKNKKGGIDFKITCVPNKCLALQNYRLILKMIDEQGWILRNTIIWHKPNHMPSSVKDRFTNAYEPVFMLVKNKKYWFNLDAVRVPHKSIDRRFGLGRIKYKEGHDKVDGCGTFLNQHPLGKNPGDVWQINTQPFPESHFAVYPEKLCEVPIKACCPPEVCKKCGKPVFYKKVTVDKVDKIDVDKLESMYKTIKISCDCNAGFEPGIVLDPFIGSGTTAVVSKKLGMRFIGFELNEEYVKIAKKRLSKVDAKLNTFF